ncbi:MAG: heparinase II/III family protein [Armatimonadota bacterium]|nr:heparinase II/III family protein [Armatimonadota bacterium]
MKLHEALAVAFLTLGLLAVSAAAALAADGEHLVGGPLAGVELPPFPTQHGEKPGFPGCIPELMARGEAAEDMGHQYREWGPQGQAPELQLYPGSVEHYRAYMFKYMPIRSFFDRQSQLMLFVAPDLPGAGAEHAEQYSEPVYWVPRHAAPRPTGRFAAPVPVVRMSVGEPVLRLELGRLPVGLYVVRVIGAVETADLRPFRQPLYMTMNVNDGVEERPSEHRLRLGYCDQFYSVAEFYFHAPAEREYSAELQVASGSKVDLLVHSVSLDDVLAGTIRRPLKTRATCRPPISVDGEPEGTRQERLQRDADMWRTFPPVNAQGSTIGPGHGGYGAIEGVEAGAGALTAEEIEERYGAWVPWGGGTEGMTLPNGVSPADVFLANPKLGLIYTIDDLRHNRPLPEPYPFADDGTGLYFPDPEDESTGRVWTPIGHRVHQLHVDGYRAIGRALERCDQSGSYDDAHDAALALVRFAYAFPTLDIAEYLSSTVHESGPFGRDYSCRRRETVAFFLPHYAQYVKPIMFQYDRLFEFIEGNELLAESVQRFVPWVTSPEDVIRLIDVYLVQTTAKRILRYHYHTDPMDIANLAAVVGDTSVTDPWMQWLFSRTFIYPLPVAGIQDAMISGTTREGTEIVGSTYYAQGEGALRIAAALDLYQAAGGNPRFDLSDPRRYPKPVAHAYWRLENVVGGRDFLRIGDVCGPDKAPGHTLRDLSFAQPAWRWTKDPRFAFILKHYVGRGEMTDGQWAEVEAAASKCPRAPWLENRSRVLPMWAGVLETGVQHDDPRLRRAAYVRVGFGMGHHHADTLDLQVVAHGLPMTIDGGQRPGYSSPGDRTTRVHNTVEVDGHSHSGHSWITTMADHPGARYLAASGSPPPGATLFRRQVALIDVDEVPDPQKLPPEQQAPFADLEPGVTTPSSYVFDVFRVAGGAQHTYCFHGPLHDQFTWNAQNAAEPVEGSHEAEYLRVFTGRPERSRVGEVQGGFQATWRMAVEVPGPGAGEREMMGGSYDSDGSRKFTRLHLFGADGARAMRAQAVCTRWDYDFTNAMVQRSRRENEALHSVFAAVIEPYAGEPFITRVRPLSVGDEREGPRAAVALEVTTANGHTDLLFADGRADSPVSIADSGLEVLGEFAYYSTDSDGLRQAALVGGTLLSGPHIRIEAEAAERTAQVVGVDYLDRTIRLDGTWPTWKSPKILEMGLPDSDHRTTYTTTACERGERGSVLRLQRGADYYRSEIRRIHPDGTVECALTPLMQHARGNRAGWVASNDAMTRFWRAESLGEGRFRLSGAPVSAEAFAPEGVLRLWEYGVGDTVWQRTSTSVRRLRRDHLELRTDTDLSLSLRARAAQMSTNGENWRDLPGRTGDGWLTITLPMDVPADVRRIIRVER